MPLPPPEDDLLHRRPVWEHMQWLYLGMDGREERIEKIVKVLADSPYSIRQLREILWYEISPSCILHLYSIGGWEGFEPDQLPEVVMASRITEKRKTYWWIKMLSDRHTSGWWKRIKPMVRERRKKKLDG